MQKFKAIIIILSLFFILSVSQASAGILLSVKTGDESPDKIISGIKQNPSMLYFKIAGYYFQQEKYDEAITAYKTVIRLSPNFAEAYHNIGVTYVQKDDLSAAMPWLLKAISIKEDYAKAHYSAALVYYKLKEYDVAIKYLLTVVEFEPNNSNANFDLGVIYVKRYREAADGKSTDLADLNSALHHYNRALEIDPEFPHAAENIKIIERAIQENS